MSEDEMRPGQPPPLRADDAGAIIDTLLSEDRRVLLIGQPGAGKSTLVAALGETLARAGRCCRCLVADPGSPLFGVPGTVSLAHRNRGDWQVEQMEALCTLDAGRFRLPLVSAVARLSRLAGEGTLLIDGPGVVRGMAGAELLPALVEACDIDLVLVVAREGRTLPLAQELKALPVESHAITASPAASRPGKRTRARARTALWEQYLAHGSAHRLAFSALSLIGTPPPTDVPAAWVGRQVAFLDSDRTLAMGEVMNADPLGLDVRVAGSPSTTGTLLVRDAARGADGLLGTAAPFVSERLDYLPPSDLTPPVSQPGATSGPRIVGRVGMLGVSLINGVFGDPLLHARLRHRSRSLLFDLGEGSRLSARIAHQVSDVFLSHTHVDHIAGFLWLLRSRIGDYPACRLFGPPGLADNIEGLTRGILWDRIEDRGPRFEVGEVHGDRLERFRVQAGRPGIEALGDERLVDGIVLQEDEFSVRVATLDHGSTPVLAYAFEPARQFNVRKDRLEARGLTPGPWLGALKARLHAGHGEAVIELPDGSHETVSRLAESLIMISPGKKLVYATDFGDTPDNRSRLVDLARDAHTLFCESTFREQDIEHARRTSHLTTRACGEIAEAAAVARLVPFHFSRRYEHDMAAIYEEISQYCQSVAVPG